MATGSNNHAGRIVGRTAVAGVLLAGLVGVTAPASAGSSVNLWIGSSADGRVDVQQFAGVNGTYHIDVWNSATHVSYAKTGNYQYRGGTKEFRYGQISAVRGKTLCGQLWYHKPGGGYESQGLPCHTY